MNFLQLSNALTIAQQKGILPSALGSAELKNAIAASIRNVATFSARTTSTVYLEEFKKGMERLLGGGYKNDKAQIRLEMKTLLQRLGYDAATGFPGDEALGIPPAAPGSLQDLASDARLNLMLNTRRDLDNGKAMKLAGFEPLQLKVAPCWELARIQTRKTPRGDIDSGSPGWGERWVKLGGPDPVTDGGKTRLIAAKTDPIWRELGDSKNYDDALDVDHPPFAYGSGYGWLPVTASMARRLGVDVSGQRPPLFTPSSHDEPGKVGVALDTPPVKLVDPVLKKQASDWLADFRKKHGGFS